LPSALNGCGIVRGVGRRVISLESVLSRMLFVPRQTLRPHEFMHPKIQPTIAAAEPRLRSPVN
ncbi:MAG: hypothetical protein JWO87_422, partial [Phycisphaerales bacterium]|nr:hypothetical protein [Phycisphaerales bacterium]